MRTFAMMPNVRAGCIVGFLLVNAVLLSGSCCFAQTAPAQSSDTQEGARLFSVNCAACHGLDARGGEHAPNIATDEQVQVMSDSELQRIVHTGIPGAGMPGFGKTLNPEQTEAVVRYLRTLQRTEDSEAKNGDAAAGKALFFGRAKCSECHSVNGTGGFIASDLSGYGRSHAAAQVRLLFSDRSDVPAEKLALATVVMKNGKSYQGLVRNQDNFSLQLQTLSGQFVLVNKADLSSFKLDDKALQHSQYVGNFGKEDLQNLIAFLLQAPGSETKAEPEEE